MCIYIYFSGTISKNKRNCINVVFICGCVNLRASFFQLNDVNHATNDISKK